MLSADRSFFKISLFSTERVSNMLEAPEPEPTVPLSVFQQLQTRLEQLELTNEVKRWSGAPDHKASEAIDLKRRSVVAVDNHEAQCRAWRRWFSAQQSPLQDIRTYHDFLDTLVKELHEPPNEAEYYWRMRTSIKPSIRDVLDLQVIQPNSCEELLSLALRIERNEKPSSRQDSSSRQPPSQFLPTDRRLREAHISSRRQDRASAEAAQRGNMSTADGLSGGQPGSGEPSRRRRQGRGGRRHAKKGDREPHPDGRPTGDGRLTDKTEKQRRRENSLCFDCGAAGHRSSDCSQSGSKSADNCDISRESRPRDRRPSNPNITGISWDPPPQSHIERFQSQGRGNAQSTETESQAVTYGSQPTNLSWAKWSPNGDADTFSLLD